MLGPLAICRLDDRLVDRLRREQALPALAAEAAFWMCVGAAMYGAVFGYWRSPLQAVYAGFKLPVLLAALVVTTAAANAIFAKLLGTTLSAAQILCCSLLSMAMLGIVVAALAPVSLLFVLSIASYGETLVGVRGPEAEFALRQAQWLLGSHVALIGVSGCVCLRKLRGLLASLVGSRKLAVRLFWLCFAAQALAGTQLSWILRPYLGKPGLPVEFLRPDAFRGSFFEEVARWFSA